MTKWNSNIIYCLIFPAKIIKKFNLFYKYIEQLLDTIKIIYERKNKIEELNGLMKTPKFSPDGMQITNLQLILNEYEVDINKVKDHFPNIIQKGIHKAENGAIQDPAGSAIGTNSKPSGDGASGEIYKKFTDLP